VNGALGYRNYDILKHGASATAVVHDANILSGRRGNTTTNLSVSFMTAAGQPFQARITVPGRHREWVNHVVPIRYRPDSPLDAAWDGPHAMSWALGLICAYSGICIFGVAALIRRRRVGPTQNSGRDPAQ